MELKVNDDVIKQLVADYLSKMTMQRILAKDVRIYYDPICEEVTHAFTYVDDPLLEEEENIKKPKRNEYIFDPLCKLFYIWGGTGRCTGPYNNCIVKDQDGLSYGCSYRKEIK